MTPFEPDNTAKAKQRTLILARLKEGPVSTLEARALGAMSPAARVLELRKAGWQIATEHRLSADDLGRVTRCGVYVLRAEPCAAD